MVGAIPWLFTRWRMRRAFFGWTPLRWLGVAMLVGGGVLLVDCFVGFVRRGRGTPAPIAPPERVVVGGPYRFVRNPMYVAVLAMVLGQGLLLGSVTLLGYATILWLVLHVFVVLHEEPGLRRSFGRSYEEYCRTTGRWLPRLRRSQGSSSSVFGSGGP